MRRIESTNRFKRDYKRETKSIRNLDGVLVPVLKQLAADEPLAVRQRDHALTGEWRDHRDCHIKPDLVLIYSKPAAETLRLVRLGSHSDVTHPKIRTRLTSDFLGEAMSQALSDQRRPSAQHVRSHRLPVSLPG